MIDADGARRVADEVFDRLERRDDARLLILGGRWLETQMRDGVVVSHAHRTDLRIQLDLSVVERGVGRTAASASVSDTSDGALDALVARARAGLDIQPPPDPAAPGPLSANDPVAVPLESSSDTADPDFVDPSVAFVGPHRFAEAWLPPRRWGIDRADGRYLATVGGMSLGGHLQPLAVATRSGVFHYARGSYNQSTLRLGHPSLPGWGLTLGAEGPGRGDSDLTPVVEAWFERMKPMLTTDERFVPSTLGWDADGLAAIPTAVWMPRAVATLLRPIFAAFGGDDWAARQSPLHRDTGVQRFGPKVTLRCDANHELQAGAPFDVDGVPTQTVVLVDGGVVEGPVHSRSSALAADVSSTGHATLTADGRVLPRPRFPVMDGGDIAFESIFGGADDALVIHRVTLGPHPDPAAGPWARTLIAPDGALRVRAGSLSGAVPPFAAPIDLGSFLASIDALGPQTRAAGAVVPTLRTGDLDRLGLQPLGDS